MRPTVHQYIILLLAALLTAGLVLGRGSLASVAFIGVAVVAAALLDTFLGYVRFRRCSVPYDGVITALILSAIVSFASWPEAVALVALAIMLKYVIRLNGRNVFNPAALALVVAAPFALNESWWAATMLAFLGVFLAYKVRRLALSLSFLVVYVGLNAILLVVFRQAQTLAIGALVTLPAFFAFFMLTEPVTSPHRRQIAYGVFAAVFAFAGGFFFSHALVASLLAVDALWLLELAKKRTRARMSVDAKASAANGTVGRTAVNVFAK